MTRISRAGGLPIYAGNCSICGARGDFRGSLRNTRDSFPCPSCGATQRWREQASAVLTLFARGQYHFLSRFARQDEFRGRAVLEYARSSPFAPCFEALPDYQRACAPEDLEPGKAADGMSCQDLTRLTYPDARFDLILTSDVMQKFHDIEKAVAEIARVLRPGGAHVFSAPFRFPLAAHSAPAIGAGAEALAPTPGRINEFGRDLIDMHARHGLHARYLRGDPLLGALRDNAVVAARKLP